MASKEEKQHILEANHDGYRDDATQIIHVYKRRWWVAVVFFLTCFIQSLIWNTWGPIAETSELVFGWTDGTIAQITNMSPIIFIIFVLPFGSWIDTKGLRVPMLLCSATLLVCALVRCISLKPIVFTPLAHLSALLQGLGSLAVYSGTALFAAVWFPVRERPIVTALGSFFNNFGVTVSFILGPYLVPGPLYKEHMSTNDSLFISYNMSNDQGTIQVANMESMKKNIQSLNYLYASITGLTFMLTLLYFPSKPPTPPSITASRSRTNYKDAFSKMAVNKQLWVVVIAGTLPRTFVATWIALFDIVMKRLKVSQIDAGWVSFWHVLIGNLAGIIFSKFQDVLGRRKKGLIVVTSIAAIICGTWAGLLCDQILAFNMESLYVSCIMQGILVQGPMPLFFEMTTDAAYPVGEGASGGFLTLVYCIFEIIYFGLLSIPGVGVSWMTWSCVGSLIVTLSLMVHFKETNKKYHIDIELEYTKNT